MLIDARRGHLQFSNIAYDVVRVLALVLSLSFFAKEMRILRVSL
jgi:hypothetical protein